MQTVLKSARSRGDSQAGGRIGQIQSKSDSGLDDADLVKSTLAGESAAFGLLYDRHRQAVLTAVSARISGREVQHDIVQEAFTTAFAKIEMLCDRGAFRAWVLQIGRNAATDQLRMRNRWGITECLDELSAPPASTDPDPAAIAELHQLEAQVSAGFQSLSKRDATVLGLSIHLGLGPYDIAEAIGVTPNNAKVILHRARQRLRAVVDELAVAS